MQPPTLQDLYAARPRVYAALRPTPLLKHALLDEALGLDIHVKHENHNPTCAFKVRGGLNLVAQLSADDRRRGVISASTGNHGQSIAFAARIHGVRCRIVVPVGNNPEKNAAMRAWGATVVEEGRDYDESVDVMKRLAREQNLVIAHSTNNVHVVAGAGTMTLEMLEQADGLDAIVMAIGGGSQAVGALTVVRELSPEVKVYGAQAAGASATHDTFHARAPVRTERAATFAEGVATRQPYELTIATLCDGLEDFITVTDAELAEAIRIILKATHNLVEGAGAVGLAAALKLREELRGLRVGVVFSGGNLDTAVLRRVLAGEI